MKIWSIVFSAMLALTFSLGAADADAKRLGGGSSFGKQSSNVTQRNAAPAAPANNSAAAAKPGAPAAAAVAPKRPWGAMLGGLAAGLGLAWLASSLGLGGAFGQIIMFALLALGVMLVIGFVMRKLKSRNAASAPGRSSSPFAFQGAGDTSSPSSAVTPRNYSPENVGNDASARP